MLKFYLFDQLVISIDEKLIKSLAEREAISLLWDRICDIANRKYEEELGIPQKEENEIDYTDFLDLPEEEMMKYTYIIDGNGKKTVWRTGL